MNEIDITPHGNRIYPGTRHEHIFYSTEDDGKRVALAISLAKKLAEGEVNIICKWKFWPQFNAEATMNYRWVRGFLASSVKKLGTAVVEQRLSINGANVKTSAAKPCIEVANLFWQELVAAKEREERAAKKKAKDAKPENWSEQFQFFIPDIGTTIRLEEDWTFRLHSEHRNKNILESFGFTFSWRDEKEWNVTIKAGSILSVDRIYIRKGAADFSSLTFFLYKGSTAIHPVEGIEVKNSKAIRFWAKLSDVNKMKVRVDKNRLAEN